MQCVRHCGVCWSSQDGADSLAASLCPGVLGCRASQRPEGEPCCCSPENPPYFTSQLRFIPPDKSSVKESSQTLTRTPPFSITLNSAKHALRRRLRRKGCLTFTSVASLRMFVLVRPGQTDGMFVYEVTVVQSSV